MRAKRIGKVWLGAIIALACLAASTAWPPAAAIGLAGFTLSFMTGKDFNVPVNRVAYWLACAAFGAGIARVTGSPLAGAAAALAPAPIVGSEGLVRKLGYKYLFILPATAVTGWALIGLAFAFGPPLSIGWAVAAGMPILAATGMSFMLGSNVRAMIGRSHAWKLKVGDMVPDFTATNRSGTGDSEFTLSKQRGHWVLLTFIRGDWCPVCHVKMRLYQKDAATLAKHNVRVVVVGSSSGDEAVTFAKDIPVAYPFLADPECKIAEMFGAVDPAPQNGVKVAMPSSFLINPEGRLAHTSPPDDVASFLDPRTIPSLVLSPAT